MIRGANCWFAGEDSAICKPTNPEAGADRRQNAVHSYNLRCFGFARACTGVGRSSKTSTISRIQRQKGQTASARCREKNYGSNRSGHAVQKSQTCRRPVRSPLGQPVRHIGTDRPIRLVLEQGIARDFANRTRQTRHCDECAVGITKPGVDTQIAEHARHRAGSRYRNTEINDRNECVTCACSGGDRS